MKRMILVAGACAVALACLATPASAQAPASGQPAPTVAATRIAVVNIGAVFTGYKKATFFKQEMEGTLKPYKDKLEAMQKNLLAWQQEAQKPTATTPKEQIEQNIVTLKRQMEDVQREARALVAKKSEAQLEQLWKEINDVIVRAAKSNAFNIVLAFGDPSEQESKAMGGFANINRKLQAIEMGSSAPLYFDASVDITPVVVNTLNTAYEAAGGGRPGAAPVQPVNNTSQR